MSHPAWFLGPDGTAQGDWSWLWKETCRRFGARPAVRPRFSIRDMGRKLTYDIRYWMSRKHHPAA